jgi:hypothetical protein
MMQPLVEFVKRNWKFLTLGVSVSYLSGLNEAVVQWWVEQTAVATTELLSTVTLEGVVGILLLIASLLLAVGGFLNLLVSRNITQDSGSPHGVRSWDEAGRSGYWCPLCGLNAEQSASASAATCSECEYQDGRDTDWDIPDCVSNEEDYARIREAYVRDDLGEVEFEKQVERVVQFEGDVR